MTDSINDSHWPDYYAATVDRPAWGTTIDAADRFAAEDGDDPLSSGALRTVAQPRVAVDLGCGAGRDTRELLRRGWRVMAVDREAAAIEAVTAATPEPDRGRLEGVVAELASFDLPPCDLVVAEREPAAALGTRLRGRVRSDHRRAAAGWSLRRSPGTATATRPRPTPTAPARPRTRSAATWRRSKSRRGTSGRRTATWRWAIPTTST